MSIADRTILVTGATGRQGGAAARHLLQSGWNVRALTRDPSKLEAKALADLGAKVVQGDLSDQTSLEQAVSGVYGVYGVQDTWEHGPQEEVRQGKLLADAAKAAGVKHFVYSSVGGADRSTGIPHFDSKWEIEKYLLSTGLPTTVIRPVYFMENLLMPENRQAILEGTFSLCIHPDTRLQMVAVDDIGAFVAMAFDDPNEWTGRTIELAGDEMTMSEYVDHLSRAIDRPVSFGEIPVDEMRSINDDYATMCEWFIDHGYEADIPELQQLYPQLKTFDSWLDGVSFRQVEAVPVGG